MTTNRQELAKRLREAADWCAGKQMHAVYTDADYVALFQQAADLLDTPISEDAAIELATQTWIAMPRDVTRQEDRWCVVIEEYEWLKPFLIAFAQRLVTVDDEMVERALNAVSDDIGYGKWPPASMTAEEIASIRATMRKALQAASGNRRA